NAVDGVVGADGDAGAYRRRGDLVDVDGVREVPVPDGYRHQVGAQHGTRRQHSEEGADPVGGPRWVKGYERRPELHQREVRDRQFEAVDQQDRYRIAVAYPNFRECRGQSIGQPVQLAVAQGPVQIAHRRSLRVLVDLLFDQARDGLEETPV